jgi:hypothetical protein
MSCARDLPGGGTATFSRAAISGPASMREMGWAKPAPLGCVAALPAV